MPDLCNEIEKFGKGVGSAARYRIIETLFKGPKTVSEIVKKVKLSQPAVSQHLKTLKANDLVTDERRGQVVYYSLNSEYMLLLLKNLVGEMRKSRERGKTK